MSFSIGKLLLDILDPPVCSQGNCGRKRFKSSPLCLNCFRKLERIPFGDCKVCGKGDCDEDHEDWVFHFKEVRSLFYLEPVLKELIHGLKYQSMQRNGRFLAEYLRHFTHLKKFIQGYSGIIPVPLHPLRKRERGFNQAEVLGEVMARISGRPLLKDILKRVRYTGTQTKMDSNQRKHNLKGAFKVSDESAIRGNKYLLLDDVFTTGSTLDACAGVLISSGANEVGALTLAHVRSTQSDDDYAMELEIAGSFVL